MSIALTTFTQLHRSGCRKIEIGSGNWERSIPKDTETSAAIQYLKEAGPRPNNELPVEGLGENVRQRIGSLNIPVDMPAVDISR